MSTRESTSARSRTHPDHARETLQGNGEKYRILIEQASDAILLADTEGNIREVNRKAEELLGYTAAELLKMKYTQLHPPDALDTAVASFRQLVSQDHVIARDIAVMRKDGAVLPADITATVINYAGQKIVRGSFRDVTERKEHERALQAAKDSLVKQVQERTAELVTKNTQLEAEIETRIGYEARLKDKRRRLELKSKQLEQLNSALKVLLRQRDADKQELEEKVMLNVKELVLPYLEKLKVSKLEQKSRLNIDVMEANLNNIIASFSHKLSSRFVGLTHREIQIANMIKEGKATKEIAEFMHVSVSAIKLHRYHIRSKLGLIDQKINLRTYLSSL